MFEVIKQNSGYVLQWQGQNKPSWVIGLNNICCWFKYKKHAIEKQACYNNYNKGV